MTRWSKSERTGIEDDSHALLVGNIVGVFTKYVMETEKPLFAIEPVVLRNDDGTYDYTNEIRITRPGGGRYIVAIYPERER